MRLLCRVFQCLLVAVFALSAGAAGPRWVAGSQWTNDTVPISWYRADVQYFVDAGPLSSSVDNATATALVDAAAAVWNVPGIPFTLTNGGSLAEDVSSNNVYLATTGPVWPADVASTNYTAKQIAVILDADGSITDTLLGSGASAPANCRQNAVTESVDLFIQPGSIAHALLIVNGRCTGPAPEQQLQLQYQLMRMFGRVIGLGWSQANDNVFTGTPAPVYTQQQHWPIMHPIDIVCGPYSYQCLPQPFTLRDDDIASLRFLYTTAVWSPIAGQLVINGFVQFPSGRGMNGVNVVVHRNYPWNDYGTEPYEDVSSVSGFLAQADFGNPVTGAAASTMNGGTAGYAPGYFMLRGVPGLTQFSYTAAIISTQAINPLYTGAHAVGPYRPGAVEPSGSTAEMNRAISPGSLFSVGYLRPDGAVSTCNGEADGTEPAPVLLPAGGVWSGRLCGVQHTLWNSLAVRAGRTATVEAAATDETGLATTGKAMPVIGLWHAADATGTLPTLARMPAAFNSVHLGLTQLHAVFAADEDVRLAIADQRGDGRPDYTINARVLYADTVSPARMGPAGGAIRIMGLGFQPGSMVTVGGVLATVTGVTATEVDAIAPALSALGIAAAEDVTVTDPRTGATTTITAGLNYGGALTDVLTLVFGPSGNVAVGAPATFMVRLTDANGIALSNAAITVTVPVGSAVFSTCGLAICTLTTDASGIAQTYATAQAAGSITLRAATLGGVAVQANYNSTQATLAITLLRPTEYVAAGAGAVFHPAALLVGSGAGAAAVSVTWTSASSRVALSAPQASGSNAAVSATGALRDDESATVQACAWTDLCVTGALIGVPAADLRAVTTSGGEQNLPASSTLGAVMMRVTDTAAHPVAGAAVHIYQQVTGWQPPCPTNGRCAVAPVYGTSAGTAMSEDDGSITVTPLQYANTAAVTAITLSVGISGTVTATLQKTP